MSNSTLKNQGVTFEVPEDNWSFEKGYRFRVAIVAEDDGTVSVLALNLPGAVSSGETEEEALANFEEAAREVMASYADAGESVPWKEVTANDIPAGAQQRWINVNA